LLSCVIMALKRTYSDTVDWLMKNDNATSFLYTPHEGSPSKVAEGGQEGFTFTNAKHVLKITDLSPTDIEQILQVTLDMKRSSNNFFKGGSEDAFADVLKGFSILCLFEKPSLRTRVSLEVAMHQMGGQAIPYSIADSPLGKKESVEDTGKVLSRMCQGITARVSTRNSLRSLAQVATVPVVNALDDYAHPMQMLADLLTIKEHKGTWKGLTMAYLGDVENNVTYDLMRLAALMGYSIRVAGVGTIEESVWEECKKLCEKTGGSVLQTASAAEAVSGVDVIYTDSWMSYGIPAEEEAARIAAFMPFQVTVELLGKAKPDCIFMNCLPAARGKEQTAEVIDGPQSVVFDQAENRLHTVKALLVRLLRPGKFEDMFALSITSPR